MIYWISCIKSRFALAVSIGVIFIARRQSATAVWGHLIMLRVIMPALPTCLSSILTNTAPLVMWSNVSDVTTTVLLYCKYWLSWFHINYPQPRLSDASFALRAQCESKIFLYNIKIFLLIYSKTIWQLFEHCYYNRAANKGIVENNTPK